MNLAVVVGTRDRAIKLLQLSVFEDILISSVHHFALLLTIGCLVSSKKESRALDCGWLSYLFFWIILDFLIMYPNNIVQVIINLVLHFCKSYSFIGRVFVWLFAVTYTHGKRIECWDRIGTAL